MTLLVTLLFGVAAAMATRGVLGVRSASRRRVLLGLPGGRIPGQAVDAEPLSRPFAERVLRPVIGSLGGLLGRLLPGGLLASTAVMVQRAAVRGRPSDWLAARALVAVGVGGYMLLLLGRHPAGPLLAVVGVALGWSAPAFYLRSRARSRARRLRMDLPDALDLLTVCVEAGLGFDQAMSRVVDRFPGPVAEELGHGLRDQRLGTPRRQALLGLVERVDLPELRAFVFAVLQAEELGVRIGTVLRVQSDALRQQRRQRAEEAALKAPVKMAFPMIFLILPSLFLVILGPAVLEGVRALAATHP